jgi:hypothetical protein
LIIHTGWKIGANQQISQLQLEGFLVKTEYNHFKQRYNISEQNSPGQILMSLQESAMSIFSQYFADNVLLLQFFDFKNFSLILLQYLPFFFSFFFLNLGFYSSAN